MNVGRRQWMTRTDPRHSGRPLCIALDRIDQRARIHARRRPGTQFTPVGKRCRQPRRSFSLRQYRPKIRLPGFTARNFPGGPRLAWRSNRIVGDSFHMNPIKKPVALPVPGNNLPCNADKTAKFCRSR